METGEAKKNPSPPVPPLLPPPPLSTAGAFPPLCLPSAPFLPSAPGRIHSLPSVPGRIRALAICRSQSLLQSRQAHPGRIPHRWARPQPSPPLVGRDERRQACSASSVDERAGSTQSPSRASSTSSSARWGQDTTGDGGRAASSSAGPSLTRGWMPSRREEIQFGV
jgi:hypothetical protein